MTKGEKTMKFKDSRITLLNLLAVLGRVPHSANAMTFTVNEGSASIARKGSDCELSMRLAETAVINHGSCAVDFQQFKSTLERMDAVMVTVEQAYDLPLPGVPSTIVARKGLTTLIQPLFHFFL